MVREHHWPPDIIGGFFIDAIDFYGIEYWYNDIKEVVANMKKK